MTFLFKPLLVAYDLTCSRKHPNFYSLLTILHSSRLFPSDPPYCQKPQSLLFRPLQAKNLALTLTKGARPPGSKAEDYHSWFSKQHICMGSLRDNTVGAYVTRIHSGTHYRKEPKRKGPEPSKQQTSQSPSSPPGVGMSYSTATL